MTKIKQKYYKRLENDLYNYKYLKLSIDNIKQDIRDFNRDDGVGGIDFGKIQISKTNAFSSMIENATISNLEKLDFLEHCMNRADSVISKIDKAILELEEKEKLVIIEKYINSKLWWQVAMQVRYGERQCRRIRNQALRKMSIAIYGLEAIQCESTEVVQKG